MRLLFLLLCLLTHIASFAEVVAPSQSSQILEPQSACEKELQAYNCEDFKADEAVKNFVRDCMQSSTPTAYELAKTCLSQGLGVWGEALKSLQQSPEAIMSAMSKRLHEDIQPDIRLYNWKTHCLKKEECLRNLIKASTHKSLNEIELNDRVKSINNAWFKRKAFDRYYHQAVNRDGLGNNTDPWFSSEMKRVFPQEVNKSSNIILQVKDKIEKEYDKYVCLNSEGRRTIECYVFFSIVDPALALGIVSKAPKVAKIISATSKSKKQDTLINFDFNIQKVDGEFELKIKDKTTNKYIGNMEYEVQNNELHIQNIYINSNYQNNGFATEAFKKVLAEHPGIKKIHTDLVADNYLAIKSQLKDHPYVQRMGQKMSSEELKKYRLELDNTPLCIEAIKQTPAYKIRAKMGFIKIVYANCFMEPIDAYGPELIVERE